MFALRPSIKFRFWPSKRKSLVISVVEHLQLGTYDELEKKIIYQKTDKWIPQYLFEKQKKIAALLLNNKPNDLIYL